MMIMDVVYPYRSSLKGEELKHSMRSLVNLPHNNVWVIGDRERWFSDNVNYIPTRQDRDKWGNSHGNISVAVANDNISDDFIIFHDDFFVIRPIDSVPNLHRGSCDEVLAMSRSRGGYYAGMVETKEMLVRLGFSNPLCYELHIPRVVNKQKWIEARDVAASVRRPGIQCLHSRTFYGNYWQLGGDKINDVKVSDNRSKLPSGPFLSTSERSWATKSPIQRVIKNTFSSPSPYERSK